MSRIFPMAIKPILPPAPVPGAKNLGDLVADTEYYGNPRTEGVARPGIYQPVAAPIIPAPVPANAEDFMRLLGVLPDQLIALWRKNFLQIPREVYPIFASGDAELAANSSGNIVSYTVPDRMSGFITNLGFYVAGNAGTDVTWSLLINGAVHPTLSEQNIFGNSMPNPYPFPLEVIQSSVLALRATNALGNSVEVQAVLVGWLERMTPSKDYGGSPASGIG